MLELQFFECAAGFYTAATVLAFVYLYSKEERWSCWMLRLITLGVLAHAASFAFRLQGFWAISENRYFLPINSFFGALSFMALAVTLTFAVVEGRHRLGILGAFVLPWACAGSLGALWRAVYVGSTEITGLEISLQSPWMNIHPMLLMTAYAVLGNAFGVGLALLIQERQMKSRRPSELCYRLPAIEELDALNYHLISFALPVFILGIILGGVWARGAWGRFWNWDAKETWALITVLVYAWFLRMRWDQGWRGRRTVYASMIGFACALFTFIGVNSMSVLHGYLSKRTGGAESRFPLAPLPACNSDVSASSCSQAEAGPVRMPAGRIMGDISDKG